MKLLLVDPSPELCAEWLQHFVHGGAEVQLGRFESVSDADGLVTAGNSFGLMDGGVDLALARFASGIEYDVQRRIRDDWHGELPVGSALSVPLGSEHSLTYRRLIYAPTMRVPLDIRGTDNIYKAMWAALAEAGPYGIKALVLPGLGTGAGRVPPDEAARLMSLAWRNWCRVPERMTWDIANRRHHEIDLGCCGSWVSHDR